jgi:hypothetical protein
LPILVAGSVSFPIAALYSPLHAARLRLSIWRRGWVELLEPTARFIAPSRRSADHHLQVLPIWQDRARDLTYARRGCRLLVNGGQASVNGFSGVSLLVIWTDFVP